MCGGICLCGVSRIAGVWCRVPADSRVRMGTKVAHRVGDAQLNDCCTGFIQPQQRLSCGVQVWVPRCDERNEGYSAEAMAL